MGYAPDWNRQSMAKTGGTKAKIGIVSKPLFHGAKEVKHFADGGEVQYNETDAGALGGEIKFRTDAEGRKYVPNNNPSMGRGSQPAETRYYSMDDVKNFFTGGRKQEADSVSTAPAPKTTNAPAPSAENESRKATIAAPKQAETATSEKPGVFANWKSDAKVYERAPVESKSSDEPVVRKFKPAPEVKGRPLKEDTSRVESRKPVKADNREAKAKMPEPSEADVQSAQDAGTRFVSLTNYVKNLPAGTSPEDRAKIGQLMRDAQTDYENKSKKVRR